MSDRPAVKPYTPWGLKFFITIFFVIVSGFMLTLKAYKVDPNLPEYVRVLAPYQDVTTKMLVGFLIVAISAAGIVFIWMNKPVYSAVFVALLLVNMLIPLFFLWGELDSLHPYGYLIWGTLGILIILVILALFLTKEVQVPEMPKPSAKPLNPNISVADEIRKFKELMDEGIISKEEFEEQKNNLLGKR